MCVFNQKMTSMPLHSLSFQLFSSSSFWFCVAYRFCKCVNEAKKDWCRVATSSRRPRYLRVGFFISTETQLIKTHTHIARLFDLQPRPSLLVLELVLSQRWKEHRFSSYERLGIDSQGCQAGTGRVDDEVTKRWRCSSVYVPAVDATRAHTHTHIYIYIH